MFPIDPSKLPSLRTRKALLVIDPQNDFLDDDGALPIHQPIDLPEKIAAAVQTFRANGVDIIWVRSQFEKIRSVNNEMILTSDLPLSSGPSASSRSRSSKSSAQSGLVTAPKCPEGFLSIAASSAFSGKALRRGSPGIDIHPTIQEVIARKDQVLVKSFYSAFKNDQILRLLRMRIVTELFICGSLTNVGVMATAYDAASHGFAITIVKDCCGNRSPVRHNAAIKQIVELTGCEVLDLDEIEFGSKLPTPRSSTPKAPTSPIVPSSSIYPNMCKRTAEKSGVSTTATELQDSLDKLTIQDNVSKSNQKLETSPENAKEQEEIVDKTDSTEIVSEQGTAAVFQSAPMSTSVVSDDINESSIAATQPQHSAPKMRHGTDEKTLEDPGTNRDGVIDTAVKAGQEGVDDLSLTLSGLEVSDGHKVQPLPTPEVSTKAAVPIFQSKVDDGEDNSAAPPKKKGDKMRDHHKNERDESEPLCEGDSKVIFNILPPELADHIFEKVRDEVQWQRMSHQGGEVPRLVAVQGQVEEDGSMPVYRHPSDESPPLFAFTPTVTAIKEIVEKELGHSLNHALIQFYRHGNDHISEHSDKTLDIAKGSYIANVSLGAERSMVLRTKRTPKAKDGPVGESKDLEGAAVAAKSDELKRRSERAPLPHNSLMKMGLQTNMKWLHGIRQDKRAEREKSEQELAYDGGRISLTFRKIGTFLDAESRLIWGQGATAKTRDAAREVINGQTPKAIEMLRAFGRENQLVDFDWDEFYGKGFDVLHISASPRLFLSADPVANMGIQMMLAEYGVGYARGSTASSSAASGAKDQSRDLTDHAIKFVDTDSKKSTVQGQLAIMLYLDRVYGSIPAAPASATAAGDDDDDDDSGGGAALSTTPQMKKKEKAVQTPIVNVGKMYTLFQQALSLRDRPDRNTKRSPREKADEPIRDLFSPWEVYISAATPTAAAASEARAEDTSNNDNTFLASTGTLTLADFAFWPVLHDVVVDSKQGPLTSSDDTDGNTAAAGAARVDNDDDGETGGNGDMFFRGMPGLKAYYDRVKAREGVRKVLGVL